METSTLTVCEKAQLALSNTVKRMSNGTRCLRLWTGTTKDPPARIETGLFEESSTYTDMISLACNSDSSSGIWIPLFRQAHRSGHFRKIAPTGKPDNGNEHGTAAKRKIYSLC